jgi:hypothetical protein
MKEITMNKSCPEIIRRRRRSLLAGLIAILFILSIEFTTDCFDYSRFSTTIEGIRQSPQFPPPNPPQEQAVNEVEQRRSRTRLDMTTHVALFVIALWCLFDAIRINAAPIQPVPDGKSAENESPTRA